MEGGFPFFFSFSLCHFLKANLGTVVLTGGYWLGGDTENSIVDRKAASMAGLCHSPD